MFSALEFFVIQPRTLTVITLLHKNFGLCFVLNQVLTLMTCLGYTGQQTPSPSVFLFSFVLYADPHTYISDRDCTRLQCFYKVCSTHCGSPVFPYQAPRLLDQVIDIQTSFRRSNTEDWRETARKNLTGHWKTSSLLSTTGAKVWATNPDLNKCR
jgi:hypothetical protein